MAKTTPHMRIDVNTRPTVATGISQNRCDYSSAKQFQPADNRNYYNKVKTSIINRMGNKAEALESTSRGTCIEARIVKGMRLKRKVDQNNKD